MRTFLFVFAAVSCLLATPQAVFACSCAGPPPSPLIALAGAAAVFTGTVIEIVEVEIDKFESPLFFSRSLKLISHGRELMERKLSSWHRETIPVRADIC